MEERPPYFGTQIPRRRHPNSTSQQTYNTSVPVQNQSNQVNIDFQNNPATLSNSNSFTTFSNYISSAAGIWNTAQNSFGSFAEQYCILPNSQVQNSFEEQDDLESDKFKHIPVEMPFRDRTNEFRAITKSTQISQRSGTGSRQSCDRERILKSTVQFNQLAKRIGRDLSMTCAKMEKLTQLARNKSLFDDQPCEIQELSNIIKQDITGLNKQINNLQQIKNQQSGSDKQSNDHFKQIVVGLQSKLATVSTSFKTALETRTENLKMKRNRREKFSNSMVIPSGLPQSSSTSILIQDDTIPNGNFSSMNYSLNHGIQEQQALLIDEDDYHQSRFNAIEGIEKTVTELGAIFRQLASLVSEQDEMITRIDSNVEDTSMNIEAAHHELLKYFNNISKNRWLILKIFGVLMAFFVFFIIFLT